MAFKIPIPPINARILRIKRGELDLFVGNLPAYRGQRISEEFSPPFVTEQLDEESGEFFDVEHPGEITRVMSTELAVPVPLPLEEPAVVDPVPDPPPEPVEGPEGAAPYVGAVLALEPDCYWRFGEDSLEDFSDAGKLTCEDISGNGHTGIVRVDRTEVAHFDPANVDAIPPGEYDTQGLTTPWLNARTGATLDGDGCLDMGDHRSPGLSNEELADANPHGIRHAWSHPGGPWDVHTGPEWQFVGDIAAHDPIWGQGAPWREDGFYPIKAGGFLTVAGFAFRDNLDAAHTLFHGQGLDVVFEPGAHVLTVYPPGESVTLPLPPYEAFKPLEEQPWRRWFHFALTVRFPPMFDRTPDAGKTTVYINGRKIKEWTFSGTRSALEPGGGDHRTGAAGNGKLRFRLIQNAYPAWPWGAGPGDALGPGGTGTTEDLTPEECYRLNKGYLFPAHSQADDLNPAGYTLAPDGIKAAFATGDPTVQRIYPRFFTYYQTIVGYHDPPLEPGELPNTAPPYTRTHFSDPFTTPWANAWTFLNDYFAGPDGATYPPEGENWMTLRGEPPESQGYYDILPYPIGGWTARIPDWPGYPAARLMGLNFTPTPPFYHAAWDFEEEILRPEPVAGIGLPYFDPYQWLLGYQSPSGHYPFEYFSVRRNSQTYGAYLNSQYDVYGMAGSITPWRKKHQPGDSRIHPTGEDFGWPIRVGAGWNGLIDEWSVWEDRILTAAEIAYLFAVSKLPAAGYVPPEEELPAPPDVGEDPFTVRELLPGDAVTVLKGTEIETVIVDAVEDRSDAGYQRAVATDEETHTALT